MHSYFIARMDTRCLFVEGNHERCLCSQYIEEEESIFLNKLLIKLHQTHTDRNMMF